MILGLGDLGGICLEMLVRAGINKFVLVDYDKFKYSNLNRQILFTIKVLDKDKVLFDNKRIKLINPNLKVKVYEEFINEENIKKFINFYGEIIDFGFGGIYSVREKLFE